MADLGLAKEPWQREHATRAYELFTADQGLAKVASMLAAVHRAAVDYIEQAPVIALAVHGPNNHHLELRRVRAAIVAGFLAKAGRAHRLNELLRTLDLKPALRQLHAANLRRRDHALLELLNSIEGPRLAQVIPSEPTDQRAWLDWLDQLHVRTHGSGAQLHRRAFLLWAVSHCRDTPAWLVAGDIYDWVRSPGSGFSPRMSYGQAFAASQRWHEEVANRLPSHLRTGRRLLDRRVARYAPLPERWEHEGWQFVALNTLLALEEESLRMHHCVRTYWSRILDGQSRIYSIRHEGRRLATLEVNRDASAADRKLRFRMVQIKGVCNAAPTPEATAAVAKFLEECHGRIDLLKAIFASSAGPGSPALSGREEGARR